MQQIIDFVLHYWMWLLPIFLSIVEFLLLLIFKRDKILDNSICFRLIPLIKNAESLYGHGHGKEKLKYVIDQYHLVCPEVSDKVISYFVDELLDTPQKKGGK